MAIPTPKPARISLLRRRTWRVNETAVNPLIRLVTSSGASMVAEEHAAEETNENRRVKTVVPSEQER